MKVSPWLKRSNMCSLSSTLGFESRPWYMISICHLYSSCSSRSHGLNCYRSPNILYHSFFETCEFWVLKGAASINWLPPNAISICCMRDIIWTLIEVDPEINKWVFFEISPKTWFFCQKIEKNPEKKIVRTYLHRIKFFKNFDFFTKEVLKGF